MRRYHSHFEGIFRIAFAIILIISISGIDAYSQNRLPVGGVSGDEIVAFPPTTTFEQAIAILSDLSTRFEGKVIIDPTGTKGPINVKIDPMRWKQALLMILRANGLEYVERATYYELTTGRGGDSKEPTLIITEGLINSETRQFEISSIFFQADRRNVAEAGIDWNVIFSGDFNINTGSIGGSSVTQEFFQSAFEYTSEIGSNTISTIGLLQAFEALNIGKIISTPSVTVMDGADGSIQVGQSFSIKTRDFAGNTTEDFFEVGTILKVTPTLITDKDISFIHLKAETEKSSAFPDPVSTVINIQTATTEVLLLDGEQTVIAGLFSKETSNIRKGIPILKDLPWWFFGLRFLTGYSSSDDAEKELIIVIKVEMIPSLPERLERRKATLEEVIKQKRDSVESNLKPIKD